jgi:hypothetical protein
MAEIPGWRVEGDWFDVCKCNIPCPCYFAQPPSYGDCDGVLAWHVRKGKYGKVSLDDLNVLALSTFVGNVWAGAKATIGIFIDQRASEAQREALQMIFGGRAGGWPSEFAKVIGEVRGIEYASISFEVASDLAFWRAEIPGKVMASADALTGPTTRPGDRVQVHNPPGSEVGPGTVATQGVSTANQAEAFGFRWEWSGRSSKHMQFTWSGP